MAALTVGLLTFVTVTAGIAIISGLLDGQHALMAVLTAMVSGALAWFGGRLASQAWTPAGTLTEPGMAMVVSLWIAAAALTWAYLVGLVELIGFTNPSFTKWALSTSLLSPIASIMLLSVNLLFGGVDLFWYSRHGSAAPFQWSTAPSAGSDGTVSGGGGDWDARAILLAILAMVAGSLAMVTVWLLARAGARSRGVRLSFGSAFIGRPPRLRAT